MIKKLIILFLVSFALQAKENFTSVYTDFSKDCKSESAGSEGGDEASICKGQGGYTILITYSACMESILIESKDKKEIIEVASQTFGASNKKKLEWRLFKNKAVGIIFRTDVLKDDPNANCPMKKTGKEQLEIKGLGKFGKLNQTIPSGKKANEKAREILDRFVSKTN